MNAPPRTILLACSLLAVALAGCVGGDDGETTTTGSSDALRDQLNAAYDDHPIRTTDDVSPHNTPAHVFLDEGDGRYLFVHYDNDDPTAAEQALFVGDLFAGDFCLGAGGVAQGQFDAGYVHFHSASAPNWDGGHNDAGSYDPAVAGFWFRHIGAQDASMTMMGEAMTIRSGEIFPLMPADEDRLEPCA